LIYPLFRKNLTPVKILLVEDDKHLSKWLQLALIRQQYQVEVAIDGQMGWELAEAFSYDLILLDLMLPKLDGIQFCQRLRADRGAVHSPNQDTPVLLMTALNTITNKVMGLDAGADDYVVKPIDLEELQARIRALQRRSHPQRSPLLQWGKLSLQPKNCEVTYDGKPLSLSAKEYELLELFLRYPDQIFTPGRLIEKLWAVDATPTENAVRVHIKELRKKLKQGGAGEVIETVYKLGYRLRRHERDPISYTDREAQTEAQTVAQIVAQTVAQTVENLSPADSGSVSSVSSIQPTVQPELQSEFWAVWQACRETYSDRLSIVEQAVADLESGTLSSQLQQQAEQETHTLIGSLGSFGLEVASRLARQLQQLLKSKNLHPSNVTQLAQLVRALRQEIETPAEMEQPEKTTERTEKMQEVDQISAAVYPLSAFTLLIIDDDETTANQLVVEAASWGIRAEIVMNLDQARQQLSNQLPDVVLLDLDLSDQSETGLNLLAEVSLSYPDLPVLIFSNSERFMDRVEAARLGSKAFLQKPIAPPQVLAAVVHVLQQSTKAPARLLIVDDDPHLLKRLQCLLEPQGYHLTLLSDIQRFWQTLDQTAPDLLILDVEFGKSAHCKQPASATERSNLSGFDLCQVVRNDPYWGNLPILFLSAHTDTQTIQQGFAAGADDFLNKPIAANDLLMRVRKRLEQRQSQQLTEGDGLTGLSNRCKAAQDLTRLLRLAQRYQQPLSLALLDLDQFKQINDQYGHEMGDRVLQYVGKLLRQSFRVEDVVGRWGGEEFVVGMYATSRQDGVKRLQEVLQTLRQENFIGETGSFEVTFSAGVAQFSVDGQDLQTLCRVADAALYQVKAQGRNRVLASEI